ncbi:MULTISPECIES: 2-isopropylmalate synthase [Bhargavaea]|uniref:2-isopropylmalate synthase n=1 Tax=Bhargavaea changchunensis TaxID=2134037 RepID=A0ABW2NIM4_9BACL|nr:2-isopropylmalate synthase [Bhargavaea sp. CC-171006]
MRKIDIFDTTLRDGEQSAGINLNTAEKLEIARQLERLGVTVMEAGFPAASPGDQDAVRKIAGTVKNSIVTGLARCNQKDIDAAWEALRVAEQPHIHIFLATSPIHMAYKLKKTPDEVIEASVEAVKYAKKFFPLVQWSAEDGSRTEPDFLARIVTEVVKAGATTVNIPDTVGYATPQDYGSIFKFLKETVPNIDRVKLSAHCHDDLGMATANTLAAIENGADQVEGTINAIGERAGNVGLEEVAVALHIRKDHYNVETGINLKEIKRTSQLVSQLTGVAIQPNKAVTGKNAFAHESGIHQDGMLKNPNTYEIITPELIGDAHTELVLGKHSGRHAFKTRAEELGFSLEPERLNEAFAEFKKLADRKKVITEADLLVILTDQQIQEADAPIYELSGVQLSSGTANIPTATITVVRPDGETVTEAATGTGSVETIFNALERIVSEKVHILDYRVSSVGKGRDALGEAVVKVLIGDDEITGRDAAQDVLEATANAYLNAINRKLVKNAQQAPEATVPLT